MKQIEIDGKIVKKGTYVFDKGADINLKYCRIHSITKGDDRIAIWANWVGSIKEIDAAFDEVKDKHLEGNQASDGGELRCGDVKTSIFADTLDELKQEIVMEKL